MLGGLAFEVRIQIMILIRLFSHMFFKNNN
jgi:hypothetical protein